MPAESNPPTLSSSEELSTGPAALSRGPCRSHGLPRAPRLPRSCFVSPAHSLCSPPSDWSPPFGVATGELPPVGPSSHLPSHLPNMAGELHGAVAGYTGHDAAHRYKAGEEHMSMAARLERRLLETTGAEFLAPK
eukprot:3919789-Prymnesium_polylepis.1